MREVITLDAVPNAVSTLEWTVRSAVERRRRHAALANFDADGFRHEYADVTLRVEPSIGSEKIVFINAIPSEDETRYREWQEEVFWLSCVEGIVQGVSDTLHKSAERGFPLIGVSITLTRMEVHSIDSNSKVCRRVGHMVLGECLEDNLITYVKM